MENGTHPEPVTAPMNTISTPGPGNDRSEDSNTHEDNRKSAMITGSRRQSSIDSSSRFLLGSNKDDFDSLKNGDDFDLLWRLRKYLVLLGVLAVNVTYNAGLTPPGGFWTQNKADHDAGDPVLRDRFSQRYEVFFYCNATAFAASLVLIILLLSKRVTRKEMWLRSMQFTMILDLFSLLGAYAAGSCRALKSSIYIWVLVLAVFVYVGIHTLVYIRVIPETLRKKLKTMLNGILSKWSICDWLVSSHLKKEIEEARKFILMLVTFAATITYQAGLNPPGGFWAENEHDPKLPSALRPYKPPATSVLRSNYLRRYNIFVTFNSTSFVASLVIVILLLSPELSRHGIRTKAVIMCVVADLLCLIGAYAAGCCRDVATSFYVLFTIVIVFISFALLAGIFVYKPVAQWLEKVKSNSLCCMSKLGRILSLKFGSNRSSNAEQDNSHASCHHSVHSKDAPVEDNPPEPEDQSAGHEQVSNGKEAESHEQHPPAHKQQTASIEEAVSNSQHPSGNSQQSANTKDAVSNLEDQSTDYQLVANIKEDVSNSQHTSGNNQQSVNTKDVVSNLEYRSTDGQLVADMEETESSTEQEHPLVSYQQTANTNYGMSPDNQRVASMKGQSSTDDLKITVHPVEQSLLVSDSNGATDHDIVEEGLSGHLETSGNVDYAKQNTLVEDENRDIENGGSNTYTKNFGNGHTDSNRGAPDQNSENNQTEKHLKKTRTYLLLLAILAVSLTYQSGLNPPGGFWSRSEYRHSAGDRILEDTHHRRFIAFFYLNAVAFVASIVMIVMLLNKMMSKKVTKRRALPITMIVVLLSLTGAFAMGNCREAKNSIVISVLVCLVFAYAVIHALIAIHIIPGEWKRQVSEKLKHLSCKYLGSVMCQSDHASTGDGTSGKEMQRRCNLLLTLAILAATVTYQAGLNPPGGVWSDEEGVTGMPGNPVLEDTHRKRYDVFYYSNSVSFVSSVVVTILLVNKESCEHGIKSYALRACLVVGLLGLLIAYVAGSCRNHQQSIYLSIIAVAVLVSLVIQVLLSSMHDTLGRPLAQFIGFLQMYLLPRGNATRAVSSKTPEASDTHEKIVRKRHKYLMLLAILAASITYQAGLNPPGGFSDDGNPILRYINHQRYKIFFCCNSFAFMASIVVIMLLLSKSVRKKDVPLNVLHLIMILDLLALMTAFAAGSCRKFMTSVYVYALVVGVVIYLVLVIVLSSGIAKYLRSGLPCRRIHEHASRTNVPAPGQQV